MAGEFEQGGKIGHAATGDVEHDAAFGEIGVITDLEAGETLAVFAEKLAEGGDAGTEAFCLAIVQENAARSDLQVIGGRMVRDGGGLQCADGEARMIDRAGDEFEFDASVKGGGLETFGDGEQDGVAGERRVKVERGASGERVSAGVEFERTRMRQQVQGN